MRLLQAGEQGGEYPGRRGKRSGGTGEHANGRARGSFERARGRAVACGGCGGVVERANKQTHNEAKVLKERRTDIR
jgi:hypothetical protein